MSTRRIEANPLHKGKGKFVRTGAEAERAGRAHADWYERMGEVSYELQREPEARAAFQKKHPEPKLPARVYKAASYQANPKVGRIRRNPDADREQAAADLRRRVNTVNYYMKQPDIYLPGLIEELCLAVRAAALLSLTGNETIPGSIMQVDEQLSWLTSKFSMLKRDQQPGSVANESSEMLIALTGLLPAVARLNQVARVEYRR